MKLAIQREGNNIVTFKKFDDCEGRGEAGHFIAQLEIIKAELLELWDALEADDDDV